MDSKLNFANIAVALPIHGVFSYYIPEQIKDSVFIGVRVIVPFGNRKVMGYVLEIKHARKLANLKNIINVLDEIPLFSKKMVSLFEWLADYYIYPIGGVIKLALPKGLSNSHTEQVYLLSDGKTAFRSKKISSLEKKILNFIITTPMSIKELKLIIGNKITKSLLNKMENKKWLKIKQLNKFEKIQIKTITYVSKKSFPKNKKISLQRRKILNILKLNGNMSLKDLICSVKTTSNLIKKMEKDKQIKTYDLNHYNSTIKLSKKTRPYSQLTKEQQNAINTASVSIGKKFKTFLLSGVTGSGKTEVYIRLIKIALNRGFSVLILAPEIVLVSQLDYDLRPYFGKSIAVLHSGLSKKNLHSQWVSLLKGETTIALGARSCVFAPLKNLGLIIVDEEHDTSYKQERAPFYNAKDLAIVRAKQCNAVVVLGSATPAIQSWFNVKNGKFTEIPMVHRINNRPLPRIKVVDLSKNRNFRGIARYFSVDLINEMKLTFNRGNQTLLFLNRRGFSAFSLCMNCKKPLKCKNCDISLTLHKDVNLFICHYCGFSKPYDFKCNFCGFNRVKSLGIGTEKIEIMVKNMFPKAKVARFDKDTTRKRGSAIKILKDLEERKIDILVGTQMLTKGHNFPGITLVGIICADFTINFPDFRSTERTFQLIAQVAGRAGRGKNPGRVVLQTYNPEHFSIIAAKKQDFKEFYKTEIKFRKMLVYPPFSRIIQLRISGKNKFKVDEHAKNIYSQCLNILNIHKIYHKKITILGPIESPIAKIDTRYRRQLTIKSSDNTKLHLFMKTLLLTKQLKTNIFVRVSVDVDPISMM